MTNKMQKIFTWINVGIVSFLTLYFTSNIMASMIEYNNDFIQSETLMYMSFFFVMLHFGFSLALLILASKTHEIKTSKLTRAYVIMNFVCGCLPAFALLSIIAAGIIRGLQPLALLIFFFGYWLLLGLYIATLIVFIILQLSIHGNKNKSLSINQPLHQNDLNQSQPMVINNSPVNNQTHSSTKEDELDRRLEKLINMFNSGKLSKEEFESLKAKLLEQY